MRMTSIALIPAIMLVASCSEDELTRRAPRSDLTVYTEGQAYDGFDNEALHINLGLVPVFATKWAIFKLANPTQIPLQVEAITYNEGMVTGQRWGEAVWTNLAAVNNPQRPLAEPGPGAPFTVPPFGEFLVGFPYAPLEEGQHQAVATLHSNAANGIAIEMTIDGTAVFTGAPDLEVQYSAYVGPDPADCTDTDADTVPDTCLIPEENALNFGNIGLGAQGTAQLILRNVAECEAYVGVDACSLCSLTIDQNPERQNIGFGFKPGTNDEGVFAFAGSTATPFTIPQRNISDPCNESGEIKLLLTFNAPLEEDEFEAVIVVESNDPDEPLIEIPVKAASRNAPIAIAKFRELDPNNPSSPWTNPDDIQPLQRAYFDGRDSYDATSSIASYQWQVIEYPSGLDTNDFQMQGETTGLFSFWLPLAGHYVVQLTVWNDDGIESGDTPESKVEFDVIPGSRLHVQLTWDDTTNDQDLHLVYLPETEETCNEPWDCYFSNKTPQWFSSSPVADGSNPRLDIDDTHGLGPENINIDDPEPSTYRIRIHYWADYTDHSATRNTVRVFLNGLQVAEYRRTLSEETVWNVADITWLADGTGYVTPYPSDAAGQVGSVETFLRDDCWGGF